MNLADFNDMQDAISMAAMAHAGQNSREIGVPYISHPCRVATAVTGLFGHCNRDAAIAALLHDTLEKTALEPQVIGLRFGPKVLSLVNALTKQRGEKKAAYLERLVGESWEAHLIKIADALDHLKCPPRDLTARIMSADRLLGMELSSETLVVQAKRILRQARDEAKVGLVIRESVPTSHSEPVSPRDG